MSTESSTFLSGRQPNDCRPQADIVVYYDGTTADKPIVEGSTLVFNGSRVNVPNQGIGYNSVGASAYRVDYAGILSGGAGIKFRCATADLKQRLRLTVKNRPTCPTGYLPSVVSLELKPIETCERVYEYDHELPLHLFRHCSTMETNCQILEELGRQFNRDYAHLGAAGLVGDGSGTTYLDIEAKEAGQIFRIEAHEGLSVQTIIPANKKTFTRQLVKDWMGSSTATPIDASVDGSLYAIEMWVESWVNTTIAGVATSNMSSDPYTRTPITQRVTVLIEPGTNGDAILAEFKKLLKGPASGNLAAPYLAKVIDDSCADTVLYPYSVVRTDNGSAEAVTLVKTGYTASKLVFRTAYVAGKSYYNVYTNSGTTPTAVTPDGTQGTSGSTADTVTQGTSLSPSPYSVSTCIAGTPCADCPPSNISLVS